MCFTRGGVRCVSKSGESTSKVSAHTCQSGRLRSGRDTVCGHHSPNLTSPPVPSRSTHDAKSARSPPRHPRERGGVHGGPRGTTQPHMLSRRRPARDDPRIQARWHGGHSCGRGHSRRGERTLSAPHGLPARAIAPPGRVMYRYTCPGLPRPRRLPRPRLASLGFVTFSPILTSILSRLLTDKEVAAEEEGGLVGDCDALVARRHGLALGPL